MARGLSLVLPVLVISHFIFVKIPPAHACFVGVDWDHTANCSWNIFDPSPCPGFCETLKAIVEQGCQDGYLQSGDMIICDASRRLIDPDDWENLVNDCRQADPSFPPISVSPQGQNGCPNVRWPYCLIFWSLQCRIDKYCRLNGSNTIIIDSDCPKSGTFCCSRGGTVDCVKPSWAVASTYETEYGPVDEPDELRRQVAIATPPPISPTCAPFPTFTPTPLPEDGVI